MIFNDVLYISIFATIPDLTRFMLNNSLIELCFIFKYT